MGRRTIRPVSRYLFEIAAPCAEVAGHGGFADNGRGAIGVLETP